ncbi:hypothetical protein [Inconstantimicrobium mannanitabidum]|uniref:Uncharacterized protein n=1 Tax=Inconstantimicrobium mannanitabidum TaxID=1604901 RepID=A0ACB5R7T1_9CLOT|nr:hypothetical protein [Clostridium sp. TW13]GKX65243.1 hypothetical protein rsdtw13_05010 [Clostridium sp. TW13]
MKDLLAVAIIVGVILAALIVFYGSVLFIIEMGEQNIERLWKVSKVQFVIIFLVNIVIWIIKSVEVKKLINLAIVQPIGITFFFAIVACLWKHYYKTTLLVQEKFRYLTISDGNGLYGGPRFGTLKGFAFFIIFSIVTTILNFVYLFQK